MRRALVTRANRGIGVAIAKGLKGAGLEILVGARDLEAGRATAAEIGATALHIKVADADSIASAVKEAGQIDVLVNNADILNPGNLLDDPKDFTANMATMVKEPYLLMNNLKPKMVSSG